MRPDHVINLCFHGIGVPARPLEPGEERYWIDADLYPRVLDLVVDREDVRISFDDANWSDLSHGLPGLVERGLTATFFVIAGRLGERGSLDDDAVRLLRDAGMGIGSHGMDHRSWRGMDDGAAHRELVESRQRLAVLVGRVDTAAMPRGQYDRRALGQLRRSGYRHVFSSDRAPARADAWLQPRYSVWSSDTLETIRRDVLTPPSPARRLERRAVRLAKRLR